MSSYELEPGEFSRISHLFQGHKQYLPVFAVIDGNFPGRVFVDDRDAPNTALVWALSRWAYIDGNPHKDAFNRALDRLIRHTVIPGSRVMGMNWFELYTAPAPQWAAALETHLSGYQLDKHHETVYTFEPHQYVRLRSPPALPHGALLEKVDLPILPKAALAAPFFTAEFKTRTAFGFQLIRGDKLLSLCRSNGLAYGDEFMVDVVTPDEKERGQGYATLVATALIDHCLDLGLRPLWETTFDNLPSRRLAHKLGFVEAASYPVYAILF
jgi:hypothetical protein